MLDHDAIRRRINTKFADLKLPRTGVWLKRAGIGQTTIRNFLDGTNNSLTTETVSKLAGPLKTTEQWLLFGGASAVSEGVLREMAETAAEEIQAGMRIEEIRRAVASALHEQLKLRGVVAEEPDREGEMPAPDKSSLSPAPTTRAEKAGSHNA